MYTNNTNVQNKSTMKPSRISNDTSAAINSVLMQILDKCHLLSKYEYQRVVKRVANSIRIAAGDKAFERSLQI